MPASRNDVPRMGCTASEVAAIVSIASPRLAVGTTSATNDSIAPTKRDVTWVLSEAINRR
jgi:hypothetical protein